LYTFSRNSAIDRRRWSRLRYARPSTSSCFSVFINDSALAILANHYHLVLCILPDLVAQWSDLEVARRWLTLFPRHRDRTGAPLPPAEVDIRALADQPGRIALLRKRLCGLSWFIGRLNESIARAANHEDQVKGRFWESRFKCQLLGQPLIFEARSTISAIYPPGSFWQCARKTARPVHGESIQRIGSPSPIRCESALPPCTIYNADVSICYIHRHSGLSGDRPSADLAEPAAPNLG
jgi:hypothetical protein